jgi:hypothetical protein
MHNVAPSRRDRAIDRRRENLFRGRETNIVTIDSQGLFTDLRDGGDRIATPTAATSAHATRESETLGRHETPGSRAMRVSLARAFPVRTARLREALVNGSITKLTRP